MTYRIMPEAKTLDYENEKLEYVCFQDRDDIESGEEKYHHHIFGIPADGDTDVVYGCFKEIVAKHKYKPVRSIHVVFPQGTTFEEVINETSDEMWGAVMFAVLIAINEGEALIFPYDKTKELVEEQKKS